MVSGQFLIGMEGKGRPDGKICETDKKLNPFSSFHLIGSAAFNNCADF